MGTVMRTVEWDASPTKGVKGYLVAYGPKADVKANPESARVIDVGSMVTQVKFECEVGVEYVVAVSAYAEKWNHSPIVKMEFTAPEGPAALRGVSSFWAMIRRWFS